MSKSSIRIMILLCLFFNLESKLGCICLGLFYLLRPPSTRIDSYPMSYIANGPHSTPRPVFENCSWSQLGISQKYIKGPQSPNWLPHGYYQWIKSNERGWIHSPNSVLIAQYLKIAFLGLEWVETIEIYPKKIKNK